MTPSIVLTDVQLLGSQNKQNPLGWFSKLIFFSLLFVFAFNIVFVHICLCECCKLD